MRCFILFIIAARLMAADFYHDPEVAAAIAAHDAAEKRLADVLMAKAKALGLEPMLMPAISDPKQSEQERIRAIANYNQTLRLMTSSVPGSFDVRKCDSWVNRFCSDANAALQFRESLGLPLASQWAITPATAPKPHQKLKAVLADGTVVEGE